MDGRMVKYFLLLVLVFSLTGCATTGGRDLAELEGEEDFAPPGLAPTTAKLRFGDLPVPAGFKPIQDRSFIFQAEGVRVALLKYTGRAKVQDLVIFYKEQMLLYNWELLNVVEYGKIILNFERGRQSCIVNIESRGMKKLITISLAPRGGGGIEPQTDK